MGLAGFEGELCGRRIDKVSASGLQSYRKTAAIEEYDVEMMRMETEDEEIAVPVIRASADGTLGKEQGNSKEEHKPYSERTYSTTGMVIQRQHQQDSSFRLEVRCISMGCSLGPPFGASLGYPAVSFGQEAKMEIRRSPIPSLGIMQTISISRKVCDGWGKVDCGMNKNPAAEYERKRSKIEMKISILEFDRISSHTIRLWVWDLDVEQAKTHKTAGLLRNTCGEKQHPPARYST
ncbi:predicted protein [Histoplasma capsulatum var. duboisii H88]|uniref:Predicted protein n=2 Tax=Ajellomyces capsulatus TaxID=5037 RepID=F0UQX0_AJEC8|nr:predicted protein [Histoplasma capsulatum H143]EGC48296.1 predicted protein [Histoplasma capsulatum var. duboisii H88]